MTNICLKNVFFKKETCLIVSGAGYMCSCSNPRRQAKGDGRFA